MAGIAEYGLILIGVFLGAGIGYLLAKTRFSEDAVKAKALAEAKVAAAEAQVSIIEQNKESMKAEMESIASAVARQNSEDFLVLAEQRFNKVQSEATKDRQKKRG